MAHHKTGCSGTHPSGDCGHPWLYVEFVGQPRLQEILCLKKQKNAPTPSNEQTACLGPPWTCSEHTHSPVGPN